MSKTEPVFSLHPIGCVRSPVTEPTDEGWNAVESRIEINPDLRDGLRGLGDFSHVVVVTLLHRAAFDRQRHLVRRPRGQADMPEVGIFAQRAKDRPNPISVTCVRLLRVEDAGPVVQGLDAIDGTPVLDLKPWVEEFDAAKSPRAPEWMSRLMRGYF